jgi:hypothetical protein
VKVHHEEQVLSVMETPPEFNHKRIARLARHALEHGLFSQSVLQLLVCKHMSLRDRLERVQLGRGAVAH